MGDPGPKIRGARASGSISLKKTLSSHDPTPYRTFKQRFLFRTLILSRCSREIISWTTALD